MSALKSWSKEQPPSLGTDRGGRSPQSERRPAWYIWEAAVPHGRPGLGLAKHSETSAGGPVATCYPVLHRVWSTWRLHMPPTGVAVLSTSQPCMDTTDSALLPNIEMNDYKKCYF